MAILQRRFLSYLKAILKGAGDAPDQAWRHDPVLGVIAPDLAEATAGGFRLSGREAATAAAAGTPLRALGSVFADGILLGGVAPETERRIVALKLGFPHMPATTAAVVTQGFGIRIAQGDVLDVYASHGLSRDTKPFARSWDFERINRRAEGLSAALSAPGGPAALHFATRCSAVLAWLRAAHGDRSAVLAELPMKRSLFFHWWGCFRHLGLLGLADPGPELFRHSKVGPAREARIVVDRLQHPERPDSFYVGRLAAQGVCVKRNAVAKILAKWDLAAWSPAFVSDLERLETDEWNGPAPAPAPPSLPPPRLAEELFARLLTAAADHPLPFAAPGLPVLWAYLEELGIVPLLAAMGLTAPEGRERYSWLDLLLFDIGRRFLGVPTLTAACEREGPELPWFAHLYSPPCNDTVLAGLARISEEQVAQLRAWLVERLAQLGLGSGKRIAFDFHQIDLDVLLGRLRGFGKGPSAKKKLCWTAFRPHIAWDVENGTLLVAEFRKGSARGTTTVRRFVGDYILPVFRGLFETVYLDSEYTGKDVWTFVLDGDTGMGAVLTACLRQNSLVRKARDAFLADNEGKPGFWRQHDDKHEFTAETFPLRWSPPDSKENAPKLELSCVVKRNVLNGRLRVFGSSREAVTSEEILRDYSSRWTVENGIKDLIASYCLDACPGTEPHHVDVHFLVTTICRTLYRMVERDLGGKLSNPDGTVKTLDRMRDILFRQGAATLAREGDELVVRFLGPYRVNPTNMLRDWFGTVAQRHRDGIALLGGMRLRFELQPPRGEEYHNTGRKVDLAETKNCGENPGNA